MPGLSEVSVIVARGFALLDQHRPGWFNAVNVDTIDQSLAERCVVGQTFAADHGAPRLDEYGHMVNHYVRGVKAMGLDPHNGQPGEHGFISRGNVRNPALNAEWKRQILARRVITPAGPVQHSDQALIDAARISTVDLLLLVMGRPESDRALIESAVVR